MMPLSAAEIPVTFPAAPAAESRDHLPPEVSRLLAACPTPEGEEAWAAFVARYSQLLLRVAAGFAPGYDGALDRYAFILDELRRSDYRRLRGFAADGRGRFSTWLGVVARRLCLDHHRRQYGRHRHPGSADGARALARVARRELVRLDPTGDDLAEIATPSALDPAEELDQRECRAALRRAIARLSPDDQRLLRLRFEQELTAREIATVLGFPTLFHVYRRLERIYRVVRERLAGPEVGSPRGEMHNVSSA
jgi:RNA polymerase sigma factor (sigma-70 family)